MEFGLKWVHMAQYELILKLDGALWLTIISKIPLTPRKVKVRNRQKLAWSHACLFIFLYFCVPDMFETKINDET